MSLARVLAAIDGMAGSVAALDAAVRLGKQHGARVELLHVEIDVATAAPIVGEGMSGAAVEQIVQSLREQAKVRVEAARGLYQSRCVEAGLPVVEPDEPLVAGTFAVSFRHVVGREVDHVPRHGRVSDLVVMARPVDEPEEIASPAFDAALFDSGRPVLLVPGAPVERLGQIVALAWNRSREAVRATAMALPLLGAAKRVVILTGRDRDDAARPSMLADYLAGHGIAAKTWAFTPGNGSMGDQLLAEAGKAGADLLVMGAYGHSRLRELVLGGATRGVLSHGDLPVLMVH